MIPVISRRLIFIPKPFRRRAIAWSGRNSNSLIFHQFSAVASASCSSAKPAMPTTNTSQTQGNSSSLHHGEQTKSQDPPSSLTSLHNPPRQVSLVWQEGVGSSKPSASQNRVTRVHLREELLDHPERHCEPAAALPSVRSDAPFQQSTKDNDDDDNTNDGIIPDSVLQFERHLRKIQHSKKAGIPFTSLEVVHVDASVVVVHKPAGVLTVPGLHTNPCVLDLVHAQYGSTENEDATTGVSKDHMIVHRLDMDTSGLVVFGRSLAITKQLQEQFRNRTVQKYYEAVVMGTWPSTSSVVEIDLPLQRDHVHPPFMRVATPTSQAEASQVVRDLQRAEQLRGAKKKKWSQQAPKPSQTYLTILEDGPHFVKRQGAKLSKEHDDEETPRDSQPPCTRLRLEPWTGRTHQLRVHCAALGFPIVGDPTYSVYGEACPGGGLVDVPRYRHLDSSSDDDTTPIPPCSLTLQKAWTAHHPPNTQPMCLHAAYLEIDHPVTNERMAFSAPAPF